MDAKLKHRNHKRVAPVHSLSVLGKAVRLVQSVTIPSPIEIVVLCRIFALAFDLLDFLRNQTANDFLTFCRDFSPPFRSVFFSRTAHARKRKPPQPAPPAQLPLLGSDSRAVCAGCPGTPPAQRPPRCWRIGQNLLRRSRGVRPLLRAPALANRPPPVAQKLSPVPPAAPAGGSWQRWLRSMCAATAAVQWQRRTVARATPPPCSPPRYAVGVCYRRQRLLLCPSAAAAAPAHNQSLYAAGARLCAAPYNAGLCATAAARRLGYGRPR